MNPYNFAYRNASPTQNHPLIDGLYFYIEMLLPLKPRAYSGMGKLYLIQSGGADMAYSYTNDQNPFETPGTDIVAGSSLLGELNRTRYAEKLICSNMKFYCETLIRLLSQRVLCEVQETHAVTARPDYMLADYALRNWFNPSAVVLGRIGDVMRLGAAPNNSVNDRDKVQAFQMLDLAVFHDVDRIVKSGGRGEDSPAATDMMKAYLAFCTNLLSVPASEYRDFLFPTLKTLYNLTRLYYGQVAPIACEQSRVSILPQVANLRLSNDTLLAIPSPTTGLLQSFDEPECPIISTLGVAYLDRMEKFYNQSPSV